MRKEEKAVKKISEGMNLAIEGIEELPCTCDEYGICPHCDNVSKINKIKELYEDALKELGGMRSDR